MRARFRAARWGGARLKIEGLVNSYVALFRGINVGGRNRLPMKELKVLLEDLGARAVRTCLQSGNAVFEHEALSGDVLAEQISAEVGRRRGFAPGVLLLSPAALNATIAANPFPSAEAQVRSLHVGFLAAAPERPDLARLRSLKRESERFELIDRCFYLHAPEGVGRSRVAANAERLLGVPMTDRNWRTLQRLRQMAHAVQAGSPPG